MIPVKIYHITVRIGKKYAKNFEYFHWLNPLNWPIFPVNTLSLLQLEYLRERSFYVYLCRSVGWLVGLSKICKKCKKWGIQPMSANINCFNGLELSISDFCFVRLSVRLFLSKFWKKCQKIIRTLNGSDSIRPRLNYTRSFIWL